MNRHSVKEWIAISVMIVIVLAVLYAAYYFGLIGLFSLLGVQFESFKAISLFVLFYFLLGIVGDFVVLAFMALLASIHQQSSVVLFVFTFFVNFSIVTIIDSFMASIALQWYTEIILAALLASLDTIFTDKIKIDQVE